MPCLAVVTIAVVGAATHAAMAGTSHGAMALVMGVMAVACLAGLAQLRRSREAVRRVSAHLALMSGGMALAHAAWLLLAGGQRTGHQDHTASTTSGGGAHDAHLLTVISVELICMVAATYMSRRPTSRAEPPGPAPRRMSSEVRGGR